MQGIVARETIYDWNAAHYLSDKKVLVPLSMESSSHEAETGTASDLLVAFLCASQGTPSDLSAQNVDAEVERQLKAGKPALIYFSEARTDFAGIDEREVKLLEEFKSRYPQEVRVDSFRDEKEFRAKFAQQLELIVRQHRVFQTSEAPAAPAPVIPEAHPPAPEYSKSAQSLLMSACDDPEAYIGLLKDARGLKLQVNGRQIVEQGNPESAAMWEAAFNELLANGLIRDAGCNGKLFQISAKGFEYLETLGKYPIGYIAELGGM
jgi:hypothetical protein